MAITVLSTFTNAIQVSDIGADGIAIDYNDGYGAIEITYGTPVSGPTVTGFTSGPIYIWGSFGHFGAPDLDGHPTAQHITGITSWGTSNNNLTSLANAFNGGFNGGGSASTYANDLETINLPPLPSTVTDLSGMFANCPCNINGITSWDLSGVTNTSYMFYQARNESGVPGKSRFNVNIAGWRTSVSNVTNMNYMFDGAYKFARNISLWDTTGITSPPPFFFSTLTNNPTFDEASTPTVVDTTISDFKSPFFNGPPPEGSMTLVFSSDTQAVTLPIEGIYTVNWGNGNPVPNDPSGTPIGPVIITGNVTRFGNGSAGWIGADGLLSLSGWESMTTLVNISGAFNFAINLTSVPAALPDGVTNLSYLFNDAALFNQNLSTWDTGAITNMSNMFSSTPAFNQDLSTWDTGAVTNMSNMFGGATAFNQDLHTWNTESVTNMSGMFQNATSFDQDLTTWNTESVTDMPFMFQNATNFNGNISGWNTGAVTNMVGMFQNATAFNGNISTWNTELVTNMSYMFYGATAFNGDLPSWDTGAVTNMSYMFRGATAFAGYGLESWNTGSVTNMSHMFENATTVGNVFDTWNVSNVTDMSYMFKGAIGMASPSYLWDVSKVVDMSHMFEGTLIDLNAGSWKPKRCANFSYMFAGVDLTTLAPDITLAPWASYIGISAEEISSLNFMTENGEDITYLTPISPFWADPNGTNAPKSYVGDVGRGGFPMAISFLCSPGTYLSLPISNQDGEVLIDWGDDQVNWYPPEFTGLYEHYTRISNPEIQLYANFNNFGANLWPGVNKVVSVDGWGSPNKLINLSNAFKGATILTTVPNNLPTTARNLFSMFKGTVLFNQTLDSWDVSRVTDFSDMFFQSIAFQGNGLDEWRPRAAQDMSRMFSGATAFNTNLKPWCAYLGVLTGPVSHINFFTGSDTTNPNSPWYTEYTTAPSRNPLTITFQPTPYTAQNPLIFPPNVSGTAYISLPITGVSGDLFIDWGDGTKNLYSQNQQPTLSAWTEVYEHVDLSGSNHQVKIYGDFTTFGERYNGDAKLSAPGNPAVVWFGLSNVLTVDSWGDNAILSSLKQAFQLSAFSLTAVPSNIPRTVKNTASMFLATPLFVGANLALWDVSGLTNTTSMFAGAAAFTADLSGWAYKLGPVSAYDNFFSTSTFGMSGFTDPTSQSPRSPFYIGVPTPSNPYVPAAPLVVFNAQPNPTIKVGTEVFGTVGSVLYSLNPSYTRITDLGTSTFVGTLYRPYIANVSISNKIYGAHTGGKLFSYDTVTRTLDLSAGSYQGIPTGYMVLDTNGNLYSTDSAGYVYKLAYATPTFVPLNTAALVPPVIGPLSIVNDEFLYGADSENRIVRMSIPAIDVLRSEAIDMAPTSLIVDSAVKSYFYDTNGQALWSYSPLTKLYDFSENPLDGTGPVGPILMDPTKRVLYGICSAGGRGIGTGLRGAGTLFSFDLSSSEYSVLVNYVAGDVNRGETPLDFSITTETGTAFVTTRSSGTSFQTRIAPRVANGYAVGSAELPGATTTCFNHGTKILSLINDIEAWVPVESLNIGDLVMTYLHGPRPITHIFKGVMINNPAIWHTCMYKGQKAGFEPLLVTGGHGLLVDYLTEKEQAKQQKFWGRNEVVIDDKTVILAPVSAEFTQITDRDIYTYYHFVVENDGDNDRRYGVYANGFLTETPSKNQANSKNFKDHPVY
jgi:surface protein